MRKRISATLSDLTIQQLEDLKKFYSRDDVLGDEFSTSRLIIICVNYFWKHIFEEPNPFNYNKITDENCIQQTSVHIANQKVGDKMNYS